MLLIHLVTKPANFIWSCGVSREDHGASATAAQSGASLWTTRCRGGHRSQQWLTFDAAYVETILLQERRRRELPSPTQVRPRRQELLEETDLEEPDPADYDRLTYTEEETDHE
ncbi:MAG: hypothetical protein R3C17_10800 [Planctomycetaceae bacterium]